MNEHIKRKMLELTAEEQKLIKTVEMFDAHMKNYLISIKKTEDDKFWHPEYKGITFDTLDDMKLVLTLRIANEMVTTGKY